MEDFKITVDFRNSSGKKISFEYDLDVIDPYLESLFGFFIDLDEEQERKNVFENFMAEMIKAKNLEKTLKGTLDEMRQEADAFFGNAGWRICMPNKTTVNTPLRDLKGRFVKKDSKKK